jgi:hypothetical protein
MGIVGFSAAVKSGGGTQRPGRSRPNTLNWHLSNLPAPAMTDFSCGRKKSSSSPASSRQLTGAGNPVSEFKVTSGANGKESAAGEGGRTVSAWVRAGSLTRLCGGLVGGECRSQGSARSPGRDSQSGGGSATRCVGAGRVRLSRRGERRLPNRTGKAACGTDDAGNAGQRPADLLALIDDRVNRHGLIVTASKQLGAGSPARASPHI